MLVTRHPDSPRAFSGGMPEAEREAAVPAGGGLQPRTRGDFGLRTRRALRPASETAPTLGAPQRSLRPYPADWDSWATRSFVQMPRWSAGRRAPYVIGRETPRKVSLGVPRHGTQSVRRSAPAPL